MPKDQRKVGDILESFGANNRIRWAGQKEGGNRYYMDLALEDTENRFVSQVVGSKALPLGNPPRCIVLVSCVGKKRSGPCKAKDLYTSTWFQKARRVAETHSTKWWILSAKEGLLDPEAEVEPYEQTLRNMGDAGRRTWATKVYRSLRPQLAANDHIYFLAGDYYRGYLERDLDADHILHHAPMEGLAIGKQLQWLGTTGLKESWLTLEP